MIWFTADSHFGHENIIKFCSRKLGCEIGSRPFKDVEEMDKTMIDNWNEVVKPEDIVYHVGDFAYANKHSLDWYLQQLNGKIHLIVGSHDKAILKRKGYFEGVWFQSISDLKVIEIEKQKIVLCHYAMRTWAHSHYGSYQLFAHSHGQLEPIGLQLDVGVDTHNYYPYSFDEIKEIMKDKIRTKLEEKKTKIYRDAMEGEDKVKEWIWNPKTKRSGMITCIPQQGLCPNKCEDCFFQNGRSYLEPLKDNLPHIPPIELTKRRVVRINDGNDSNIERELVEKTAQQFDDYFFNTAVPRELGKFSAPVVLTVNPGEMTDDDFYLYIESNKEMPLNLMYIRVRTNTWNLETVVKPAIEYYTLCDIPVVLTFMAYFTTPIPEEHKKYYEWKKRTLNSYWVIRPKKFNEIMDLFKDNSLVYSCGSATEHACKFCGNCLRGYYATKERIRTNSSNNKEEK